ncbi:MAG: IPT/TIG domain-containing protein [Acidobacteriota bacterium]
MSPFHPEFCCQFFALRWFCSNRRKRASGDTSRPIAGATSMQYTTTPSSRGTHDYWVRAANMCGVADSNTATITAGPLITSIHSKSATPGSVAYIFGRGFSTKSRRNTVFVGGVAVTGSVRALSSNRLQFVIPDVPPGMVNVHVEVRGVRSNTVKFEVR